MESQNNYGKEGISTLWRLKKHIHDRNITPTDLFKIYDKDHDNRLNQFEFANMLAIVDPKK